MLIITLLFDKIAILNFENLIREGNQMISPKQTKKGNCISQSDWYSYYAGFSDSFVSHYISYYAKKIDNPLVLDPWNGGGTTTLVSSNLGYNSIGYDINPVALIISKAKLFDPSQIDIEDIKRTVNPVEFENVEKSQIGSDLLFNWFSEKTVQLIRNASAVINRKLTPNGYTSLKSIDIEKIDCRTAFFNLVLFKTVKTLCTNAFCSNPVWIKLEKQEQEIDCTAKEFWDTYFSALESLINSYTPIINANALIGRADSRHIPLKQGTVNIVMTSPPYCTRVDYVISSSIELAVIGYSRDEIEALRNDMIGTPTIGNVPVGEINEINSITAQRALRKIHSHHSKAAKTYYYKTYFQYFASMQSSVQEIDRVLAKDGIVMLVIQDSYFKDILVDVSKCIREMFYNLGYQYVFSRRFKASNNMRYINTKSRQYNTNTSVDEKLIVLRKGN